MLGRIGSGTFSEVFTVSLRETRAATKANEANERGGYSYVPWLVCGNRVYADGWLVELGRSRGRNVPMGGMGGCSRVDTGGRLF